MNEALDVYSHGLAGGVVWMDGGDTDVMPINDWDQDHHPGDDGLLERCQGATLDAGCGPGRLTAALLQRGVPALGVDISDDALRLARGRGATVLRRDLYDPLPRTGEWQHVLLADGNIGIGGDPIRLLMRCRDLLAPQGSVLLDLSTTITGMRTDRVRLRSVSSTSPWFPWTRLGRSALPVVALAAGLGLSDVWWAGDRLQAELHPTARWDLAV